LLKAIARWFPSYWVSVMCHLIIYYAKKCMYPNIIVAVVASKEIRTAMQLCFVMT